MVNVGLVSVLICNIAFCTNTHSGIAGRWQLNTSSDVEPEHNIGIYADRRRGLNIASLEIVQLYAPNKFVNAWPVHLRLTWKTGFGFEFSTARDTKMCLSTNRGAIDERTELVVDKNQGRSWVRNK